MTAPYRIVPVRLPAAHAARGLPYACEVAAATPTLTPTDRTRA